MKKYLISGALALIAGVYLTSCTDDTVEYASLYEEKTQTFEKVFKDLYGTLDPKHDWGFTPINVNIDSSAVTNALTTRSLTRAASPNANEWADTWIVPNPLTDNQKDLVRKYFQRTQDPVDETINYTDFFVQDVYKGGTTVDSESKTTETQYAAYGDPDSPFYGSNQMDQLSAGLGDHISNYNNAQCSVNNNVSSSTIGTHSDKIMLMTNSSTAYFGYNNSLQSSYKYNDMFKRVSGNTIMQWAEDNNVSVPSDGDVSGMYFVGFDYEADLSHGLTDTYQGNSYLVTEVPEGTAGAFQIPNKQNNGDWQQGKWYIAGARDHYYSDWIIRIVPATNKDTSEDKEKIIEETTTSKKYTATIHRIMSMGRVFVEDLYKATREDLDYNDAVFDAIIWQDGKYQVEVNSSDETTYTPIGDKTYRVEIALLAAGGTIPLKIAGDKFGDVHNAFGESMTTIVNTVGEASNVYGSSVTGKSYVYKEFDYTEELAGTDYTINNIPIDVQWVTDASTVAARLNNKTIFEYQKDENGDFVLDDNGNPIVVSAGEQVAPHIILAPIGTPWAAERVNIQQAHTQFGQWVSNQDAYDDTVWKDENADLFYCYGDNRTPLAYSDKYAGWFYMTDIVDSETLWSGTKDYGNWTGYYLDLNSTSLNEGDKIRIYYNNANVNSNWLTVYFEGYYYESNGYNTWIQKEKSSNVIDKRLNSSTEYVEFEVTSDIINYLSKWYDDRLYIYGQYFTLTKIELVR